jgi:dephospho-CoA kinase
MIVIGLTGGTGAGKGCVCQKFLQYNINSLDTDWVSREVCSKGTPCLNELVKTFGNTILNDDGTLNRKRLGSIVFSDREKLNILNSISHRYILDYARNWLDGQKADSKIAAIIDAPLLYESGFDKECDIIIAVISNIETRKQRILTRDNLSTVEANKRLNNQGDDDFYSSRADYVITNNGSLNELELQVDTLFTKIFGKEA